MGAKLAPQNSAFDLKKYWSHFPMVSQRELGGPKMRELESIFAPLKAGTVEFSLRHIDIIKDEDSRYWRFLDWWRMPEIDEADISDLKNAFSNVQPFNEGLITKLFNLLKNIEIVSCLFRFISPEDYAIFSTPVEDLLNIKGRTPVIKYLGYLRDLDELKSRYQFSRIADVDMALWTLARIINSATLKEKEPYRSLYECYWREPNPVKRIMARNALDQIWGSNEIVHIADLFLQTDLVVAGFLAGRALELHVKKMCQAHNISLTSINRYGNREPKPFSIMVKDLYNRGAIDADWKDRIYGWWEVRCDLVHEEAPLVEDWLVCRMVSEVIDFAT